MHQILIQVGAVATNPFLRLLAALVLMSTGLYEVLAGIGEDLEIGVHHGALLYGGLAVLRALPEAMEGLGIVAEVHERSER